MKQNTSIIFGWHPILEALMSGKEIQRVYIQQGLKNERSQELLRVTKERNIPVQFVPVQRLEKFTRKTHQGVVAMLSPVEFADLPNLLQMIFEQGMSPAIIALDGVTDVGNFGAICRSAEGLGFHGITIPMAGTAPLNEDAIKTSSGALLRLPVCRDMKLITMLRHMKESGLTIIGMTEKASEVLENVKEAGPVCLVMGSEETGLSLEVLKICDQLVRIPMHSQLGSLNVSVSAAIGMYHFASIRGFAIS